MKRVGAFFENTAANTRKLAIFLVLLTGLIYGVSNPNPQFYYDYTFRVALGFIHGTVGLAEKPPTWLNEFVPLDGRYYSVFPLGAVLTMLPFAALKAVGLISDMPAALIAAATAGVICGMMLLISSKYPHDIKRRILLTAGIMFGTWMWVNLTMAGTWQLALGFAMIGELGAIYFTVFDRRPLIAGAFFALAFGNRTEIFLTAPIFLYLLETENFHRRGAETQRNTGKKNALKTEQKNPLAEGKGEISSLRLRVSAVSFRELAYFCSLPLVLGVATLWYNYVRFGSPLDFGYARIPGVLKEPWYGHGIFSIYYVPRQAWEMLIRGWELLPTFPYFVPNGFSSSILFSSPLLLFAFRRGSKDRSLKIASWLAIAVLTFLLWIHGNSGGWQFGYRYAMVLLPWVFVILLETSPKKITPLEWVAYIFSFAANIYAICLFHWTGYLKP